MTKSICVLSFCWLFFCANAQIPAGDDWKLVDDKEYMKVYSRLTEKSKFKEIKMDVLIDAPCEKILDFISIASKFPEWIYSCSEAYSIRIDNDIDTYYIRFDMMWPVSDRDIVQFSQTKKDPATGIYTIHTQAITGKIPEKENVVRVKDNRIIWNLIPLDPGRTRIIYYAISDPGGVVPAWLVNQVVTIGPRRTMDNLIKAME